MLFDSIGLVASSELEQLAHPISALTEQPGVNDRVVDPPCRDATTVPYRKCGSVQVSGDD